MMYGSERNCKLPVALSNYNIALNNIKKDDSSIIEIFANCRTRHEKHKECSTIGENFECLTIVVRQIARFFIQNSKVRELGAPFLAPLLT